MLEEIDSFGDIGRNQTVMPADAIHLHGEQNRYAEPVEITRRGDRRRRTQALAVENHPWSRCAAERLADKMQRRPTMAILERFGVDARPRPQIQRELTDAPMLVSPAFQTAQK